MSMVKKLASIMVVVAFAMLIAPASAVGDDAVTQEVAPLEVAAPVDANELPESYLQVDFATLYGEGQMVLPEGVQAKVQPDANGLLLSGTVEALNSGYILLKKDFVFEEKRPVGRMSVDGLAQRGADVTASVYLDGAKSPSAQFQLKAPMKEAGWSGPGCLCSDVYNRILPGTHSVSLTLTIDGKSSDEQVEVVLRNIEFSQMTLPVMYFTPSGDVSGEVDGKTYGTVEEMNASAHHSVWCKGNMSIKVPDGYVNEFGGAVQESYGDMPMEMRGRGNSTWSPKIDRKKPYRIKFDEKQNLFGMGKNKNWVLLANTFDPTLMRNRVTLWLGRQIGLEFTPKCVPVEVVVDGDYYGSYLLCEQVRVDKNRVDIADAKTTEPEHSGYLLSCSQEGANSVDVFHTRYSFDALNVYPSAGDGDEVLEGYSIEDYHTYIRDYVQKMEDAIFGLGFKDKDGVSYDEYLDVESTVKYWWVQAFTNNGDAFGTGSTYFYKKGDGKLYWGPLWDFDIAWERRDAFHRKSIDDLVETGSMPWTSQLMGSARFRAKLVSFWDDVLRSSLAKLTEEGGVLDRYADEIAVSWVYSKEHWSSPTLKPAEDGDSGTDEADPLPPLEYEGDPVTGDPEAPTSIKGFWEEVEQLRGWTDLTAGNVDDTIDNLGNSLRTVTLEVDGKPVQFLYVKMGRTFYYLPEPPAKEGYLALGWVDENGAPVTADTQIKVNTTLKPSYVAEDEAIRATSLCFMDATPAISLEEPYYTPYYTILPASTQMRTITWSSSDDSIATVDERGVVTAKAAGVVTITGSLPGGASGSFKIMVVESRDQLNKPTSIALSSSKINVGVGDSAQVKVRVLPYPASTSYCFFNSLNPEVASVDQTGIVTGLKKGTATIEVINYVVGEGKPVYCTVVVGASGKTPNAGGSNAKAKAKNTLKVKGKTIKVKAVKLEKKARKVGAKKAFKVTGNASKGSITYKKLKGNAKIKVAKNGKVTIKKGLKKGTYKIKVRVTQRATEAYEGKVIKSVKLKVKVS